MTVKELRDKLAAYQPDVLVVGRGYEEGYDDVGISVKSIVDTQGPGKKEAWWNGRYDDADYGEGVAFDAVVIA